jgi:hypothetical protein
MRQVLKKYLTWAILAGILYGLLSYHFIIVGRTIKPLKKSELTLNYTFYSIKGKRVSTIMAIDELREDGIGELLLDAGMMSESEYRMYVNKYDLEEETY